MVMLRLAPLLRTSQCATDLKGPKPAHPPVCVDSGNQWAGPSTPPSSCFPLTSVFLSTYLTSLLHANTNQHFMCPAQWNDLPEAIWQGPPPAAPPVIRRRCAGVPVAGLSVLTPFPTSHASLLIASVGGLRNLCAAARAWTTSCQGRRVGWEQAVGVGKSGVPHSKPANSISGLNLLTSQCGPLMRLYNTFMVKKNKVAFLGFLYMEATKGETLLNSP